MVAPLDIEIEIYLMDTPALAVHKGTNNSRRASCPGVRLRIELDDNFAEEYQAYIADTERIRTVPVEFYHVDWRNFAGQTLTFRSKPVQPALIDPSVLTSTNNPNRYVLELARDFLTQKQRSTSRCRTGNFWRFSGTMVALPGSTKSWRSTEEK